MAFHFANVTWGQVPANCFEIESILADACGSPEGENEMVRFKVGNAPLNVADIIIVWPSNPYLGICQNATTAQIVSDLNATISSCGYLLEPTGGVLPAGKNVLIITSEAIDVTANSFTNLTDTLYTIFQCIGNTNGHFANYNTLAGLRTLAISFANPSGCIDSVTYDRTILINQNGTLGGTTALKNGARIDFAWDGTPTYANDGCQAPIIVSEIEITTTSMLDTLIICPGDSIVFNSLPTGGYNSLYWTGGDGAFSFQDTINTVYYSAVNDTLPFYIYGGLRSYCNDSIKDSIYIEILPKPSVSATAPISDLCPGEVIDLTATGVTDYLWNTGEITSVINTDTAGTYVVYGTNGCFVDSVLITITANGVLPSLSISGMDSICIGESTVLTVSGSTSYSWSTGQTVSSINVNFPQSIYVFSTNTCGSDTAFVDVVSLGVAPAIAYSGADSICAGDSTLLIVSGDTLYTWSTGIVNDSIYINTPQNIYAFSSNVCGSDTVFVIVGSLGLAPSISLSGLDSLCLGDSSLFSAAGGTNYSWSTSQTSDSIYIDTAQSIYVFSSNICGVDTAFATVTIYGTYPTAQILGLNVICDQLQNVYVASGGDNYLWWNGSTNDSVTNNIAQIIYVVASNTCGSDTAYLTITDESVTAMFTASDTLGYSPLSIDFTNQSINAVNNNWFIDNTFTTSETDFSNEFMDTGLYVISLWTESIGGCTDTAWLEIEILPPPNIIVPNVFTPNGDGKNNTFFIDASFYENIEGTLYNRWGEVVFEWFEKGIAWDGRYDGKESPEGTYYYIISCTLANGKSTHLSGSFSLFR